MSHRRLASILSMASASVSLLAGGAGGCTCGHGVSRAEAARDFGEVGAPAADAEACAAYLATARAVLEHVSTAGDAGSPAAGPARRVVLALYAPPSEPIVVTALGTTTLAAVTAAAETIAARVPAKAALASGRLELDIPTRLADATLEEDMAAPIGAIGLEGVLVIADDGTAGAVLPGEIVQRGLFHEGKAAGLTHGKLVNLL